VKVGVNIYKEIRTIENRIKQYENAIEVLINSIDGNSNDVISFLKVKLVELKDTQSDLLNAKYEKIIN
jgi:hypothetical protein